MLIPVTSTPPGAGTSTLNISPSLSFMPSDTPSTALLTSVFTDASTTDTTSTSTVNIAKPVMYWIKLPLPPPYNASTQALWMHIQDLQVQYLEAGIQLKKNYTQLVLMDKENAQLRNRAYHKEQIRGTKKKSSTHPQHMTVDECLDALAQCKWEMVMKNALKELAPQLKLQWKQIDNHYKQLASEAQQEMHNQKEQE
ncbi:hypothetical protein BDQ17DRAFT_1425646 [Cyathus striatus]|nr:hypothetical protein BDQ17DRAFT_1425646 [Cyathus striatus]